jgi:hypothetical protein
MDAEFGLRTLDADGRARLFDVLREVRVAAGDFRT